MSPIILREINEMICKLTENLDPILKKSDFWEVIK